MKMLFDRDFLDPRSRKRLQLDISFLFITINTLDFKYFQSYNITKGEVAHTEHFLV